MKTSKKIISLLLVFILLLSCSPIVMAESNPLATRANAVVLVLDISGSMDGNRIVKLKEATNKFAEKLIEGGKNNKIAIVTFANSCTTLPFTNDLLEIKHFMSIKNANGGTDMTSGISLANSILSDESVADCTKSIVIMSDGDPDNRSSAKAAATALFDKYNIYSIGLNLSSSQKTFMQSIQNKGYFDAENVDELVETFSNTVEEILNPFTINLSYGEPVRSENRQTPGSYTYKYEITAEVINENSKQAENVKVSINLGQSMILSSGSDQTVDVGTLGSGETATIKWNIEMPMVVLGVTMYDTYSVTASSDNTSTITVSDKIIIGDSGDKNNELDFSKDIWSFRNYSVDKSPLTSEDYNAFITYMNNSRQNNAVRQDIYDSMKEPQNGQCYGMSATTILTKMHIIGISDLQENSNCLYDVNKNEKSMSLINYYHLTQILPKVKDDIDRFNEKSLHDKLTTIKSLAQSVNKGGNPFILLFSGIRINDKGEDCWWGHAVVAYAYEAGNFTKNGRTYSNRILIYDCNSKDLNNNNLPAWDEDRCLYFNEDDNSWCIPKYQDATTLNGAVVDLKLIDLSDVETNRENYKDYMTARKQTHFIISSPHGNYRVNGLRTTDLNVYCTAGGPDYSSPLEINLPNKNEKYSVTNVDGKNPLDLSIMYDNYYMVANSSKCDSVEFDPNGSVGITGNETDFEVKLTGNKGYAPLSWYTIAVSGNSTTNPTLTRNDNGYIFEGDNLENIIVTGNNDEETKDLTFSTTEDKVLISESDNEITASIDEDNNGTFETVIASSDEEIATQLENLEANGLKLIPGFKPVFRYYLSFVNDCVSNISLTPTLKSDTTATISVNGADPVAFNDDFNVKLNMGMNTIKITVTDSNGINGEYELTVVRGVLWLVPNRLLTVAKIIMTLVKVVVQYLKFFLNLFR